MDKREDNMDSDAYMSSIDCLASTGETGLSDLLTTSVASHG